MLALCAELEATRVDLYLDRQGVTGLARAVARGAKLGRPQISTRKERAIREAKAEGLCVRQLLARVGAGVGAVHNVLKG